MEEYIESELSWTLWDPTPSCHYSLISLAEEIFKSFGIDLKFSVLLNYVVVWFMSNWVFPFVGPRKNIFLKKYFMRIWHFSSKLGRQKYRAWVCGDQFHAYEVKTIIVFIIIPWSLWPQNKLGSKLYLWVSKCPRLTWLTIYFGGSYSILSPQGCKNNILI